MLILWCSSDSDTIKKVIGPVLSKYQVQHQVVKVGQEFPAVQPNDVVLAFGSKALGILQAMKVVPKNRTIGSLRETALTVGFSKCLVTYDPGIVFRDYTRMPEVQWDVALAVRLHNDKTLRPKIGKYRWVEDFNDLIDGVELKFEKTGKPVNLGCDLETLGLDEYNPEAWIISISFSVEYGKSDLVYFKKGQKLAPAPNPWEVTVWEQVSWLLTTNKVSLRGANFKYDSRWLNHHWGINCTNQKFDTVLVGSLLDENRSNSLKLHAKIYTGMGGYEDDMDKHDKARMDLVPKGELLEYAGGDTDATLQIADRMKEDLLKDKALTNFYVKLVQPSAKTFEKMERNGIYVDLPYYRELQHELETDIVRLEKAMLEMVPNKIKLKYSDDLKITRPVILKEFLFTERGLNLKPKVLTEKTQEPSTAMDHLMMFMEDPVAANFISLFKEYGSTSKTLSTYVIGFLKHLRSDGRFHASYMLHRGGYGGDDKDSGTNTGRTSAKDPAVQCLVGGTLVLTNKGEVPIAALVQRYEAGEDFKVLTHTGKWQRVVGVFHNGEQDVFSVSSGRGAIRSTGNHPYLTGRGWVRTDELREGDICYAYKGNRATALDTGVHQSDVPQLGCDEESLHKQDEQGLASIWEKGDNPLPGVVRAQELPCGYGGEAGSWVVDRAQGCQRELREDKLRLGCSKETGIKPGEHKTGNARGPYKDGGSVGGGRRYYTREAALPFIEGDSNGVSLDEGESVERGVFHETVIRSIVPSGRELTFDITVEGSHSFVANGVVVHNTIPKHTRWTPKLRRAFIAPPGYAILEADYSQGELKIAACLADEPTMLEAYREGADLHAVTAMKLNGITLAQFNALPKKEQKELRSGGKAGNFGLIYGMGANGYREYAWNSYGVKLTPTQANDQREAFFELYAKLPLWHETYKNAAHKLGYVRSPLGRVRHLPLINAKDNEVRSQSERQAVNAPVQSCLSDMMQLAMTHIDLEFGGEDIRMFLMTHDSVSLYCKEDEVEMWAKRITELMGNLPLKKEFHWAHQIDFTADASVSVATNGVHSLANMVEL